MILNFLIRRRLWLLLIVFTAFNLSCSLNPMENLISHMRLALLPAKNGVHPLNTSISYRCLYFDVTGFGILQQENSSEFGFPAKELNLGYANKMIDFSNASPDANGWYVVDINLPVLYGYSESLSSRSIAIFGVTPSSVSIACDGKILSEFMETDPEATVSLLARTSYPAVESPAGCPADALCTSLDPAGTNVLDPILRERFRSRLNDYSNYHYYNGQGLTSSTNFSSSFGSPTEYETSRSAIYFYRSVSSSELNNARVDIELPVTGNELSWLQSGSLSFYFGSSAIEAYEAAPIAPSVCDKNTTYANSTDTPRVGTYLKYWDSAASSGAGAWQDFATLSNSPTPAIDTSSSTNSFTLTLSPANLSTALFNDSAGQSRLVMSFRTASVSTTVCKYLKLAPSYWN